MGFEELQRTKPRNKKRESMTQRRCNTEFFYRFQPQASMKLVCLFVFFMLFIGTSVRAGEAEIKAIVQSYARSGIKIGVSIHDTKTSKELFTHNADQGMNPASTMKVVTSVASLSNLSGAYEYKTPIYTDGMSGGTLQNIYIKGVGDPSLVEERLWRIAKDLFVRGVRKVSGDIIIDNSYFDSFDFAGKEGDNNTRAYNASLSPLAVNFNSFAVVGKNYGGAGGLEVNMDPPTEYFSLKSNISGSGNGINISRTYKDGREFVIASGGVSSEKVKYANAENPVQYAGTTFKWVLAQVGIEVTGKVKSGKVSGQKLIFEDKSKPLSLILRDLNKFSNNFTAEMVLRTLSAVKVGVPGSTEKGAKILNEFVSGLGVATSEFEIHNGSGLSRNNRISANALTQCLLEAYSNSKIRTDFISSLAIGGVDGTLKTRMQSAILKGNVKAKTGTLNDVSSLSGYIDTKKKNTIAYTILVNGPGAGAGGYYSLQERVLTDIYNSF